MAVLMENISCGIQMIQTTRKKNSNGQYERFMYITEDDGDYRFE